MKKQIHTPEEKLEALNMLKENKNIIEIAKKFKCSERTIWRWKAIYNGDINSLNNKSSRPLTNHPNAHTQIEIDTIKSVYNSNSTIGIVELYGIMLNEHDYKRSYGGMYRFMRKSGLVKNPTPHIKHEPQPYDTPIMVGQKWQVDLKYVPFVCMLKNKSIPNDTKNKQRYYQYTCLDEATRERFIYAYKRKDADSVIDFIKRAIKHFGYIPLEIQTDNGSEFTYTRSKRNVITSHKAEVFMRDMGIKHHRIAPRTPRHNGKVERSHRNDNYRFYSTLRFSTYDELQMLMAVYLERSNNIISSALRDENNKRTWRSPMQERAVLLDKLKSMSDCTVRFI